MTSTFTRIGLLIKDLKARVAALEAGGGGSGGAGPAGPAGPDGPAGASAYQVAVQQGFAGSVAAWLVSLVGAKGDTGAAGISRILLDEGTVLPTRGSLNFIGAGVTATDNAGADRTDVNVPGGGATALTTVAATLTADLGIAANTTTDLLSLDLTVGVWELTTSVAITAGGAMTCDVVVAFGTAVGSIVGPNAVPIRFVASYANGTVSPIVTVTTAGTVLVRARAANTAATVKAAPLALAGSVTGVAAVKIA